MRFPHGLKYMYIMMVNSFNGIVKKKNGHFLSTTENGSGIGLLSIQTTAERYHGSTLFHANRTEFVSNVMLRLPQDIDGNA